MLKGRLFMRLRMFKKLFLFLLAAGIPLGVMSETFHLKNGQVVKARLMREDARHYYIQLPFGMTTLAKADVERMEAEEKNLSPREKFDELCSQSASEKDCLEAADYAVKNNLFIPALLFLKKSLIRWNPDSRELSDKIAQVEKNYAAGLYEQISKFLSAGHFRKAALAYEEAVKVYPRLENFPELAALKKNLYSSLLTEETSLEKIRAYISLFPSYSSEASPWEFAADSTSAKPGFETFTADEKLFHPRFSSLVQKINELLQHQTYLLKHKMNEELRKPLHSRKELDESRADTKKFNTLCTENNRIYKAKAVVREYTQKLSSLKSEAQAVSRQMENEALEWTNKGYEKINGQWLKGDDLKKAKGMELYKGQWLDPKAADYTARKAELDKPPAPLINETPVVNNSVPPVPSPEPIPLQNSGDNMEPQKEILSMPVGIGLLCVLGGLWWFSRKKK